MFGYVTPLKPELKIKDYEKFKAYYCGLCVSLKKNYGNIPRLILNYDMTFLAVLLDSIDDKPCTLKQGRCIAHPLQKKHFIVENTAVDYAAFCNISLVYYKLLDDAEDDKNTASKLKSILLKTYFNKFPKELKTNTNYIKESLLKLHKLENTNSRLSIDELSHPFSDLTGFIISSYTKNENLKDILYNIGYNLGKWIYIIDAYDDLKNDMEKGKFNAINSSMNIDNLPYEDFSKTISHKISFILTLCGRNCFDYLNNLPMKTNVDILYNILQYGLLDKMKKLNL
ncbi:DUF5685 family protein [Clostridium hydrogenum]|uniref:DUF5685 family protein n=1 Tax=Clostridium hydrogenum TaxID=2855764 RepID=UPI001F239EBB|nr:DUF5685 family protein [Clostridium hydrogenum]